MGDKYVFVKLADRVVAYCGTWKSVSVISAITLGLVWWGFDHHIPFNAGYWVICNLYYSIMAIFESEILLMGQKRKAEVDDQRAIETRDFVERIEQSLLAMNSYVHDELQEIEDDLHRS